jgi:hypothetical protein
VTLNRDGIDPTRSSRFFTTTIRGFGFVACQLADEWTVHVEDDARGFHFRTGPIQAVTTGNQILADAELKRALRLRAPDFVSRTSTSPRLSVSLLFMQGEGFGNRVMTVMLIDK